MEEHNKVIVDYEKDLENNERNIQKGRKGINTTEIDAPTSSFKKKETLKDRVNKVKAQGV